MGVRTGGGEGEKERVLERYRVKDRERGGRRRGRDVNVDEWQIDWFKMDRNGKNSVRMLKEISWR